MFTRKLAVGLSALAATIAASVSIARAAVIPSAAPPAASAAPHAGFRAPSSIIAGTPVVLSALGSSAAGPLTYRWDLDRTGAFAIRA